MQLRFAHFRLVLSTLLLFWQGNSQQVLAQGGSTSIEKKENMLEYGLPIPPSTLEVIEQQNRILESQGYKVNMHRLNVSPQPTTSSSVCSSCHDMGVESGWNNWQAKTGTYGPLNNIQLNFPTTLATPVAPRFGITSGAGIDRFTPGAAGSPTIPVVAPSFGLHSIQLGQLETDGIGGGCSNNINNNPGPGCAERLTFCFTVGTLDTNFIYAYAFVIENPSHSLAEMPFIEFLMLDANNDTVACAFQRYIANLSQPGQYVAGRSRTDNQGQPIQATYKPWTVAGVNLTNYIGQTLTVIITNADCARGGHFAHSYWDFKCGAEDAIVVPNCIYNSLDTLTAPSSTDPATDPYNYTWFKNNNPISIGNTQTIHPLSQNGDTFTVRVSNQAGCSWYARYVPQHDSVKADFLPEPHCGYARFINQSFSPFVNDSIFSWRWTFTGGTPSTGTGQFPPNIYFPPGDHDVTLISGSRTPGCMDTITKVISVPHNPVAEFSAPVQCSRTGVPFTPSCTTEIDDTIGTYSWSFPGGTPATSSDSFPVVTFSSGGTIPVSLIVTTTDGCSDTVQHPLQVYQRPYASFFAFPVCQNDTLSITNTTTLQGPYQPMTYAWDIQNATPATSSDSNVTVVFNSAGPSLVTLIATTPEGCIDTTQALLNIHPLPVADFTATAVCQTALLTLDNLSTIDTASSIATYQWTFTGITPDTSSLFEPVISYPSQGIDTVTLIVVSSSGCTDTIERTVNVLPRPVAAFGLSDVCLGNPVQLSDSSSIASTSETLSYLWSAPSGQLSDPTDIAPTIAYPNSGNYTITLITTSSSGCRDTVLQQVTIHPLPVADFTAPPVCLGQETRFQNASSIAPGYSLSYFWNIDKATPDTSSFINPVVIFSDTGLLNVSMLVTTQQGCLDSITKTVRVYRPPIAISSPGDSACLPICHTFSDQSQQGDGTIGEWQWSFPGGDITSYNGQVPPQVCYDSAGTYNVLLKVTSSTGCASVDTLKEGIKAYSVPTADFSLRSEVTSVLSPVFWFNGDSSTNDVVRWQWEYGDGSAPEVGGPEVSHSYASSVSANDFYEFTASLIVTTRYGCVDTVKRTLNIEPTFTFYVPNVFTPNGDQRNDRFFAKGRGIREYSISIFDRWGLEVWSCRESGSNLSWDEQGVDGMSSACGWDGTYKGQPAPQDVYVWKVSLIDVFGKPHSYIGRVSVLN